MTVWESAYVISGVLLGAGLNQILDSGIRILLFHRLRIIGIFTPMARSACSFPGEIDTNPAALIPLMNSGVML